MTRVARQSTSARLVPGPPRQDEHQLVIYEADATFQR